MVTVLAFYFIDPSLNPAEVYIFNSVEKNVNKQKSSSCGPFKKQDSLVKTSQLLLCRYVVHRTKCFKYFAPKVKLEMHCSGSILFRQL